MNILSLNRCLIYRPPEDFPGHKQEAWVRDLDNGMLFTCRTPKPEYPRWPAIGEGPDKQVWLHTIISEFDSITYLLLGYDQFRLFRVLIDMPGVGGTKALDILSKVNPEEFLGLDEAGLKKVCGPKTGEAVWKELEKFRPVPSKKDTPPAPPKPKKHPHFDDLVSALKGMGQSAAVAKACAERVVADPATETMTLQQLIPLALQRPKT